MTAEQVAEQIRAHFGKARFRAEPYQPPRPGQVRTLWPSKVVKYAAQRDGRALDVDAAGFAALVKAGTVYKVAMRCCPSTRIFVIEP